MTVIESERSLIAKDGPVDELCKMLGMEPVINILPDSRLQLVFRNSTRSAILIYDPLNQNDHRWSSIDYAQQGGLLIENNSYTTSREIAEEFVAKGLGDDSETGSNRCLEAMRSLQIGLDQKGVALTLKNIGKPKLKDRKFTTLNLVWGNAAEQTHLAGDYHLHAKNKALKVKYDIGKGWGIPKSAKCDKNGVNKVYYKYGCGIEEVVDYIETCKVNDFAIKIKENNPHFSEELDNIRYSTGLIENDVDYSLRFNYFGPDEQSIHLEPKRGPFGKPVLIWRPAGNSEPAHWEVWQNNQKEGNQKVSVENAIRILNLSDYMVSGASGGYDELVHALNAFANKRPLFRLNLSKLADFFVECGKDNDPDVLYLIEKRRHRSVRRYVEGVGWQRPDKRSNYKYWWQVNKWVVDKTLQ